MAPLHPMYSSQRTQTAARLTPNVRMRITKEKIERVRLSGTLDQMHSMILWLEKHGFELAGSQRMKCRRLWIIGERLLQGDPKWDPRPASKRGFL